MLSIPTAGQSQRVHAPSLTGLRWVAALLVFVYHVRNFGYFDGAAGRVVEVLFSGGHIGVSFFFVLSGYVLTCADTGRAGPLRFWMRRFARVWPLHALTAVCCLLLVPHWADPAPKDGISIITNLAMISSWWADRTQVLNPVSWSLTCEAYFYLLFPLLLAVLRRVCSVRLLYGLLAGSILLTASVPALFDAAGMNRTFGFFPLVRLPEFLVGIVLARLVNAGAWRGPGQRTAAIIAVLGYAATRLMPHSYRYAACTIVGLAVLIAATATADRNGRRTFWSSRWLTRLGELSFAFYLVHIPIMRTAQTATWINPHGGLVLMLSVFTASLALAWVLNVCVETPCRRWILRRAS